MSLPNASEDDVVAEAWAKLYNAPEHAERERLKARVLELEATVRNLEETLVEAIADAGYWKRQATRNAP